MSIQQIAPQVVPLSAAVPARDRSVPVDEPFASLLPDAGLQRGRVVGCEGSAAMSAAIALVARAVREGSWLLVVGVPSIGLEAMDELGVPLRRVVAVEGEPAPAAWAEWVAAAADGFELILTSPPRGADRFERKIRQRLQARGVVLVSVSVAGGHQIGPDLRFSTSVPRWGGIGEGCGRLVTREVDLGVDGRRVPRPASTTVLLPGPGGRLQSSVPSPEVVLERVG